MTLELKNLILNTLATTQYMTMGRRKKFISKYKISYDSIEMAINEEFKKGKIDTIRNLQEYEYDKNYKYLTLYTYSNNNNYIVSRIKSFMGTQINNNELDHVDTIFNKPSVKFYKENEEIKEIDIKFSIKKSSINKESIKYIVICTLFLDKKLLSVRYQSLSKDFYEDEYYINTNNKAKIWMESKLNLELIEFDSIKVFKDLYKKLQPNNKEQGYNNLSIHSIKMDDDLNGSTYFKATDTEMLPFIGGIRDLTNSFQSDEDRKLILDYIKKYEDEAIIRNIAIKWKDKFKNNTESRLGHIIMGIGRAYSVNNQDNQLKFEFMLHIIYQDEGINRERINYVIKYLSKYFD